jgi:RNA polymerase sigma factor (sigma-70 family)
MGDTTLGGRAESRAQNYNGDRTAKGTLQLKDFQMTSADPDVTALLVRWRAGDPDALNRLLTVIRRELRAIARRHLAGERRDHSMEPIAVDLALQHLAQRDERKSKVFEMRFFGGLTVEETAAALGISENTVIRDWSFARAWLRRELGSTTP